MIPNYLRKELSVLFFIINKDQTTANEISQDLELTKRTVRETLSNINKHFEEHQKLKKFIIIEKSGIIQINAAFKATAVDTAYNLKLKLLKKNLIFNYTVLLLTRTSLYKKEIVNELFISLSYLDKLTRNLNKFFADFNFTITILKGNYSLTGNEINIRIFSYLLLQDSFQDIEWPFCDIPLESIRENIPEKIIIDSRTRSNTKNRSLEIFCAILQTRIKNRAYVNQPKTKLIQTMFKITQEHFDMAAIFQQDKFRNLERTVKKTEIQYLNFFSHIFISDVISEKIKINLGKTFFTESHPYCTLSKNILKTNSILIKSNTSEDDYYLVNYYITLFNTIYFLVGDTIDCFTNLFLPPLTYHSKVKNEYMSSINDNLSSLTIKENHKKLLSNLLYNLYTSEIKSEVNIYLQLSKNFTTNFCIGNRLRNLFNKEQIMITDNYYLSDIVITDTLERTISSKIIFYLDSLDDENRWKELLFLIQDTYLEKQNAQKEDIHWLL